MRVLWCLLVVFSLLAPLGSAGITIAPADAESALSAPRATHEPTSGARRDGLPPLALPSTHVVAAAGPRGRGTLRAIAPARSSPTQRWATPTRSRAPPT